MKFSGQKTWRAAAILVPFFRDAHDTHLLFTKRTETVEHHKGQVCFPGGMKDEADPGLWETALRECREEIGLEACDISFVRELRPQITPTGFRVTPFVAEIRKPAFWKPSTVEIAEIFSVPISHLRDPCNSRFEKKMWNEISFVEPHFFYLHHDIWGMTGRVVCEFLEITP